MEIKSNITLYIQDEIYEENKDLVKLILTSTGMCGDEERQWWFDILGNMNEDQKSRLQNILQNEKDKLEKVEQEYQDQMKRLRNKNPAIFDQVSEKTKQEMCEILFCNQ